ncbi:MAG: hypothetical protein QF442_00305 [Candidatus Peribacteraceae bacterium]|jgi:hypothetical protein|nr:hypothetical protein [Candidatus Peribacteraceae bacterium]
MLQRSKNFSWWIWRSFRPIDESDSWRILVGVVIMRGIGFYVAVALVLAGALGGLAWYILYV